MDAVKDIDAKKAICKEIIEFAKSSKRKSVAERFGKKKEEKQEKEADEKGEVLEKLMSLVGGK